MVTSRLVLVTLLVMSSATFAAQDGVKESPFNQPNSQRLDNSTQNSRALDSNTPNDEALGISNTHNQNPPSNISNRPGQQVPAPTNQK